jgi:GT2 family glycosyltransferase
VDHPTGGETLPSASVVIPTYRRPQSLVGCLRALAKLDYPRSLIEIVVVDDGGGLEPSFWSDLPRDLTIRLLTQPNRGPASARNTGAVEARGDLLAFTDDDCRPETSWLSELAAGLAADPRALLGGRVINGLATNRFSQASQDLLSFLYEYFPDGRALRPFFTANNMACDRSEFIRVGGFDETFRYSAAEDRDLSERWPAEIGPLQYRPQAIVHHHHDLRFRRFLRQHHYYGRGAVHLARQRRNRGLERPRPEPISFYARMLRYPIRQHGWWRGSAISALVGLAQISGLTGMAAEALRPSQSAPPSKLRLGRSSGEP